jgi:hypothetical protein
MLAISVFGASWATALAHREKHAEQCPHRDSRIDVGAHQSRTLIGRDALDDAVDGVQIRVGDDSCEDMIMIIQLEQARDERVIASQRSSRQMRPTSDSEARVAIAVYESCAGVLRVRTPRSVAL